MRPDSKGSVLLSLVKSQNRGLRHVICLSFLLLLSALMQISCQTTDRGRTNLSSSEATLAISGTSSKDLTPSGGYFVAVPADAKAPKVLGFYRQIYQAVDALSRKRARSEGRLSAYLTALKETGYTAIYSQDDEIECDAKKCLIKLSKRSIVGENSLAQQLIEIASEIGLKPQNNQDIRRYVFGRLDGPHIDCVNDRFNIKDQYRCDFNLDRGLDGSVPQLSSLVDSGRGRLASCAMAPGTVRDAEEAKTQLDKGGLIALTGASSPGASVVGYIRYVGTRGRIELLDMYLCGDLSQDHFQVDSEARQPRHWAGATSIQATSSDASILMMEPKVVRRTPRDVILEVKFRVISTDADPNGAFGNDRFFLRFEHSWL